MVYLIALLHGLPILIIGLASNSKSWAIYTAIFMAGLGVITGNPVYIAIDLLAVGLALWFCLATIGEPSQSQAPKPNSPGWVSLGEAKKPTEVADGYVDHAARLADKRAARNAERGVTAVNVVALAKAKELTEVEDGYIDHAERLASMRALRPGRIAIAIVPSQLRAKAPDTEF